MGRLSGFDPTKCLQGVRQGRMGGGSLIPTITCIHACRFRDGERSPGHGIQMSLRPARPASPERRKGRGDQAGRQGLATT
jgi:hypothetical protein